MAKASADAYDFIVVGGGTAGCVIAARLTDDPGTRVLLLEAGSAEPLPEMVVPPQWPALLDSSASWGDTTVVQSATGTATPLPRGRVLGGSSGINAMIFTRGHRTSYDAWVEAGAKGWGFDDLLPYFKRTESTTGGRDPALRGTGGPLSVGPADPPHPVVADCVEAAVETGHPRAADVSSGAEEGFGFPDLNIAGGRRQSAADAYLAPALGRPNLDVVPRATVDRLMLSGDRCTGVEYRSGDETSMASPSREVVLTAGAIGTAQLLMLSGLGPGAHLRECGVDTLLDLPGVGGNLQDHPMANIIYNARQLVPRPHNNHGEAFGFVRSGADVSGPDLQVLFVDGPGHIPDVEEEGTTLGPAEDVIRAPSNGYTIGAGLMRPRSRGTVRLSSDDPAGPPRLDPNYFGDEEDYRTMVTGVRAAREIGRSRALSAWRSEERAPGPDATSDADLRDFIAGNLASYCHPVGTCRMGEDDMSVVDTDLRVHGIQGLRIADASVMPTLPAGNTNATVYAIAERAAELLVS